MEIVAPSTDSAGIRRTSAGRETVTLERVTPMKVGFRSMAPVDLCLLGTRRAREANLGRVAVRPGFAAIAMIIVRVQTAIRGRAIIRIISILLHCSSCCGC